jgi:hypothetical protein
MDQWFIKMDRVAVHVKADRSGDANNSNMELYRWYSTNATNFLDRSNSDHTHQS